MSVERFSVSGGELEASLRHGDADTSPVIFLHGWTLDRRMWGPQLTKLATRCSLVAIDRRGFGRSSAPPDLRQEPDDIAVVLDALKAGKAVIVGMSQSGRVAVDFTLKHPERVHGLILQGARLGPAARDLKAEEIPVEEYTALVQAGRLAEMKRRWREHVLMRSMNAETDALIDQMLTDYDGRDLKTAVSHAPDFDRTALAKLSVSTLIVTGTKDTQHRRIVADELARIMPNAARQEITGAGHMCNLCAADDYNRIVQSFLETL